MPDVKREIKTAKEKLADIKAIRDKAINDKTKINK